MLRSWLTVTVVIASLLLISNGTNIVKVQPSSMLLPAHVSWISLEVETEKPSICSWSLSILRKYRTQNSFLGSQTATTESISFDTDDGLVHHVNVTGLSDKPSDLNNVSIVCNLSVSVHSNIQSSTKLNGTETTYCMYRSIPDASDSWPYPRTGNLWGNQNFQNLTYAASHIDMWLGVSNWNVSQTLELREMNRHTLVLGSINAVEVHGKNFDIPERYFLHNFTGSQNLTQADRLQAWAGDTYRLDLTRREVAEYKANTMLQLILRGGESEGHPSSNKSKILLPFDGLFVDNVFLSQWDMCQRDVFGRPFKPAHWENGSAWQSKEEFDSAWRKGVILSLKLFREKAPHALMTGHAIKLQDPGIEGLFNGISIGFKVPFVVEGYEVSLDSALQFAQQWMGSTGQFVDDVRLPYITMFESAPPLQIGYGYGENREALLNMPPATRDFAKKYFPNMRFGLALSLISGTAFAQELGDSFHGQDWWYDELDCVLGMPVGPATELSFCTQGKEKTPCVVINETTNSLDNTVIDWNPDTVSMWVDPQSIAVAYLTWQNSTTKKSLQARSESSGFTATVDITSTADDCGSIDLHTDTIHLVDRQRYSFQFFARSNESTSITVNARHIGGDWRSYGLQSTVQTGTSWQKYDINFTAALENNTQSDNSSRISFELGTSIGIVSIKDVSLVKLPPMTIMREFDCGVAMLSSGGGGGVIGGGFGKQARIDFGAFPLQLWRLNGTQAPLVQQIIDDLNTKAFHLKSGDWNAVKIQLGYNDSFPSREEIVPRYYHHWGHGCHVCSPAKTPFGSENGCVATFDLDIQFTGTYNVSTWWANASSTSSSRSQGLIFSSNAEYSIVRQNKVVAQKVLDQTVNGDQWNVFASNVELQPGDVVELACDGSVGACVADALMVQSSARYNDGRSVSEVVLNPMDGIILRNGKTCTK